MSIGRFTILYRTDDPLEPIGHFDYDGESVYEALHEFGKNHKSTHIAVFNGTKKIYEGDSYFIEHGDFNMAKEEELKKRVAEVKSILRDCGIRIRITSSDYDLGEPPTVTFEYKGQKILDKDSCDIDMYTQ